MPNEAPESKRVLVVDDDQVLTSLLKEHMGARGFQIHSCSCTREAFSESKRLKPHFVLLDVMLGDGLGYQVARKLRMDPQLYRIPILYISSLGDEADRLLAFKHGGDEYLTKPFNLEQLLDKFKALERTSLRIATPDAATGLPGKEALQREVDRRLLRTEPTCLMLIGLGHVREWALARSERSADRAAAEVAKLLKQTLADMEVYETVLSHLGQSMFLLALAEDHVERVSHEFPKLSDPVRRALHAKEEIEQGYMVCSKHRGTFAGYPLLELTFSTISSSEFDFQNCNEMLKQCKKRYEEAEKQLHSRVFAIDQNKRPR